MCTASLELSDFHSPLMKQNKLKSSMSAGPHPSPDPSKHPLAIQSGTYAAATLAVKIVESPD